MHFAYTNSYKKFELFNIDSMDVIDQQLTEIQTFWNGSLDIVNFYPDAKYFTSLGCQSNKFKGSFSRVTTRKIGRKPAKNWFKQFLNWVINRLTSHVELRQYACT